MKKDMAAYDLIIIGGGPAGLSAGVYAARQKLNTLLVTKAFGGQIARKAVAIENYLGFKKISGLELIQKFEKHLKSFPVKVEMDTIRKIKKEGGIFSVLTSSKKRFQAKAVIIASGADPRPLEVPGEKEFIGKGVSYCVACDAPFYSGKYVAVIGGGNSGFEAAIALVGFAKKIYVLEQGPKVKADKDNQERAGKTGKIEVIASVNLKKIEGGQFVENLVWREGKGKENKNLKVQGVFVEIGSQPATSFVKGLVGFNKKDEIVVDHHSGATKTPGLFAAGDVVDCSYKQIIISAGEGAKAAMAASSYLSKQSEG